MADPITAAPPQPLPADGVYDDGPEVLADKV